MEELPVKQNGGRANHSTLTPSEKSGHQPFSDDVDLEAGSSKQDPNSEQTSEGSEAVPDPNKIGWDGPDDPENPMNWPKSNRIGTVVLISILTLFMNFGSSMFAPGVPDLMRDFHSTNLELSSFVVTVYVLGFAIAPLIIAPLSELYGRTPLYLVASVTFIIFTVGCALSKNIAMFIVFRFLAGCSASAPLAIGGGSIADLIPQEKRGGAMAIYIIGPLLGPVTGPVIGGFLSAAKGWRWVFWLLAISTGAVSIAHLFLMRETYAPVLLARKAARLRKETNNPALRSIYDNGRTPRELFKLAIVRPLKILFLQPIVACMSIFTAILFSYLFLLFTTFTEVFEKTYGFSANIIGLSYLGLGIGMVFGLVVFSTLSDRLLKIQTAKGDGTMKPEYRLPIMMYFGPIIPIGFFWYGWSAEAHAPWIVPILGTSLVGFGTLLTFLPMQVYLVDAFTKYAASAIAANTVLRCIFGAFLPMAGQPMYAALGLGWGNSLLAFIAMIFIPAPFLFYRYGEAIRKRFWVEL